MMEIENDMQRFCVNGKALAGGKETRHTTQWSRKSTDTVVEYRCTVRVAVDPFFSMGQYGDKGLTTRVWNTSKRDPYWYHSKEKLNKPWVPNFDKYDSGPSEEEYEEDGESEDEQDEPAEEDDLPSPDCEPHVLRPNTA
jgi:hypothetical protein